MITVDNYGLKGDAKKRHSTKSNGLGRWVYCKYCYKNVRPVPDHVGGIVVCNVCGYGLDHLPCTSQQEVVLSETAHLLVEARTNPKSAKAKARTFLKKAKKEGTEFKNLTPAQKKSVLDALDVITVAR